MLPFKSASVVYTEGALYVIIAAGTPFVEFLISDRPINARTISAVVVMALVAAANALKAFLSRSTGNSVDNPVQAEIVNPPTNPIPTTETRP